MSTNSKNKILVVVVIMLLLTNAVMLYFFLNKEEPKKAAKGGGREAQMVEFLKKEIGFTDQQLKEYDTLSKLHKEKVKASFDDVRANKELLYKQLGVDAFGDSAIGAVATKSAEMQREMEVRMLQHFKTIRDLCTPEQRPKFDSLFYKVWSRKTDKKKEKTAAK